VSGLFGTFLCNTEQERQTIQPKTLSIWDVPIKKNPQYKRKGYTLIPVLSYKAQTIFCDFFLRFDIYSNALGGWIGIHSIPEGDKLLKDINVFKCNQTGTQEVLWVPDSEANDCTACQMPFSTSIFSLNPRRRHHCRQCGNVFCNRCSKNEDIRGRICDLCWDPEQKVARGSDHLNLEAKNSSNWRGRCPEREAPTSSRLQVSKKKKKTRPRTPPPISSSRYSPLPPKRSLKLKKGVSEHSNIKPSMFVRSRSLPRKRVVPEWPPPSDINN